MPHDKHVKDIVEKLLREDRRCRTDAKWLMHRVFQCIAIKNGERIYIPYWLWDKLPTPESIARCKRDLMNKEGKFNEEFIEEEGVTYEKPEVIKE